MTAMRIVQELPPVGRARQLRHTLVQGIDGKHYKILTFGLYDFPAPPECATHETNVTEVDEKGVRRMLVQPLLRRFFRPEEALAFHEELAANFDALLNLKAPAAPPSA